MLRSRAETMPVVTVPSRPSGAPMAMVVSPTRRSAELPIGMGSSSPGAARETMARSPRGSVPTTVASLTVPSASRTVISGAEASPPSVTTCALVSTCPWESSTMPEPLPAAEELLTERVTTEFEAASAASEIDPAEAVRAVPVALPVLPCVAVPEALAAVSEPLPAASSAVTAPAPTAPPPRAEAAVAASRRRRETPRPPVAVGAAGCGAASAGVGSAGRTSVRSSQRADRGWGSRGSEGCVMAWSSPRARRAAPPSLACPRGRSVPLGRHPRTAFAVFSGHRDSVGPTLAGPASGPPRSADQEPPR